MSNIIKKIQNSNSNKIISIYADSYSKTLTHTQRNFYTFFGSSSFDVELTDLNQFG